MGIRAYHYRKSLIRKDGGGEGQKERKKEWNDKTESIYKMALVNPYILINTLNVNRFTHQKAQGSWINFFKNYMLPTRDSLSFKDTYRLK